MTIEIVVVIVITRLEKAIIRKVYTPLKQGKTSRHWFKRENMSVYGLLGKWAKGGGGGGGNSNPNRSADRLLLLLLLLLHQ